MASLCVIPDITLAQSTHAVGFAAGSTYGVGLSYSYDTAKFGIQITGLPYWSDESGLLAGGVNLKEIFMKIGVLVFMAHWD